MLSDAVIDYNIDRQEYGWLTSGGHYANGTFRVNIPKLMPLIQGNQSTSENYPTNIFVNSGSCPTGTPSRVRFQNYLTIPRASYANLSGPASWSGGSFTGYLSAGQRVSCEIHGKNIRDIKIIDCV